MSGMKGVFPATARTPADLRRPALAGSPIAPSVALFLALAACLLLSGGVIARSHAHDLTFLADMAWRAAVGHLPHLDYQTPVGIAFYWPYRIAAAFTGGSIETVLVANVVVGALLLALCLAALPARLSRPLLLLAVATILAAGMTGRSVDGGVTNYDFMAPYNRWGWAFAILAALVAALPARTPEGAPGRGRNRVDGTVLGVALAILYYLKISVFVPAVGVAVLALILRLLPPRAAVIALAWGAAVALGVELAWGTNAAYLADLARAADANLSEGRGLFRIGRLLFSAVMVVVFGGAALGLLTLHAPPNRSAGEPRLRMREVVMLAGMLAAAALIRAQNHPSFEVPMFGAALILAAEYGRRRWPALHASPAADADGDADASAVLERRRGVLGAILALGAAFAPAMDAASLGAHAVESNLAARCGAPALRGTPMAGLLFPRYDLMGSPFADADRCAPLLREPFGPEKPYTNAAQNRRLLRTAALLRAHARPGEVVLALEFTNPFPAILRGPPPRGALAWMDQGRTFSTTIHPDADMLLGQADLIVQTDYAFDPQPTFGPGAISDFFAWIKPAGANLLGPGQDAWAIYGAEVEARFVPVATSGEVRIWRRRGAGAPR